MKKILEFNWWKITGVLFIISGLLGALVIPLVGYKTGLIGWVFTGGLNVLLGIGLLKRIKLAFFIPFALLGFMIVASSIAILAGSDRYTPTRTATYAFLFVPLLMLYLSERKPRKKS